MDVNNIPNFYIEVNLLDAYERGSGMGSIDKVLGQGIIAGPSVETNTILIAHEFLHGIFNPILALHPSDVAASAVKLNTSSISYGQGYTGVNDVIAESFVRAISTYCVYSKEEALAQVAQDTKDGFIMTQYVLDRFIAEYETYEGTLEEFVVKLVSEYK